MQQRSVTETPHTQPKKLHADNKVLTASFDLDDMQKNGSPVFCVDALSR